MEGKSVALILRDGTEGGIGLRPLVLKTELFGQGVQEEALKCVQLIRKR